MPRLSLIAATGFTGLLVCTTALAEVSLYGKTLPDWNAGIEGGIPAVSVQTSITTFGGITNDGQDDSAALQQAINSINAPGAVSIPAGIWHLNQSITVPSGVVIRGEGDSTELVINHNNHAFTVTGSGTGNSRVTSSKGYPSVIAGADKGSYSIQLNSSNNAALFQVGDGIELVQAHNSDLHDTDSRWVQSWAGRLVGMFTRVTAINGNTLTLADPVRVDMDENLGVWAAPVTYVSQAGFENLYVHRLDSSDTQLFYVQYASNIWFSAVHSERATKSHYYIANSRHVEIRNCRLQYASQYGDGGHGYGVELLQRTTGALVVNSIFNHLRHSFVLHLGTNGNVIAYNYSHDPYQDDGSNWTPADLSFHGHYAYSNLIESNRLVSVALSDYWGPTGPDNLLLRNRIEIEGIEAHDSSNDELAIANRLQTAGISLDSSIDHNSWIRHGNYDASTGSTDQYQNQSLSPLLSSAFLDNAPDFMSAYNWPSMGSDISSERLPAEDRFLGVAAPEVPVDETPPVDEPPVPSTAPLSCIATAGNNWSSGNNVDITLTNLSDTAVSGWSVELSFADGSSIAKLWSASWTAGTPDIASALSWNSNLAAGASVSFGLKVNKAHNSNTAVLPLLAGALCQ